MTLLLLCVSGLNQKVESVDCELSQTVTGMAIKNMELHKEEVEKKALEERIRKEKEEKERLAAEEAERVRQEQERQEAERAEMERQAAEQAAMYAAEEVRYYEETTYDSGGSGVLTKSGGVNYYNGQKETYYSQRVLPGGGLNIPGRHVADDGTIRDADGYIVVASSDLTYGSEVQTSLGDGKVYDSGCASGVVDIYTDW